jgi:hypothetical protein
MLLWAGVAAFGCGLLMVIWQATRTGGTGKRLFPLSLWMGRGDDPQ